jgi:hypothetical protein
MEVQLMKINWKRIVIAAIWSELLLLAIYVPTRIYAGSAGTVIAAVEMLIPTFLGGLWVARKIKSRFILHGVLVGVLTNVLYVALVPVLLLLLPQFQSQTQQIDPQSSGVVADQVDRFPTVLVVYVALKILGAAAGAYVGGRRRNKLLAM